MTAVSPAPSVRSVTELLLSIVLVLDATLIFFVALTAFGLKALAPAPAFIGGAVLIIVFIALARLLKYSWALWLGWALQVGLVALGFILVPMFFVGAGFAGIWTYCFIKGRQIDRAKAEILSKQTITTPFEETQ
ncbi:membrane protein [marine actinobacterium PHSC20C1]|nr:membrane protein [marine actinobacterium PHSC20C1]